VISRPQFYCKNEEKSLEGSRYKKVATDMPRVERVQFL
jgi:hypothetical protein